MENLMDKIKIKSLAKDGKCIQEISEITGYKYGVLYKFIKANGIKTVKTSSRAKIKLRKIRTKQIDCDKFFYLYLNKTHSIRTISEIMSISMGKVYRILKENGVIRTRSEGAIIANAKPEKRELHRKYANEGRTGILCTSYNKYKNTWIEKAFTKWSMENKIKIIPQYQIFDGGHRYDFLICETNALIEVDGLFWHQTEKQMTKDKKFDMMANDAGYIVYRFTDKQIRKTKSKCFEVLYEAIR